MQIGDDDDFVGNAIGDDEWWRERDGGGKA